ncbi:MAG: chemotaxis protein CheC, partial [Planctomycetota bacterium]
AFEDASGFALTDLLMEHPVGTNKEWTELCISAVLETTNILCCGYLNSLSQQLVFNSSSKDELLPGPPQFQREFAESLMEFLLMPQAIQFDQVIVATTRFQLNQMPVNWNLIFVPDAASRIQLASLLDDHA